MAFVENQRNHNFAILDYSIIVLQISEKNAATAALNLESEIVNAALSYTLESERKLLYWKS